MSKVKDENYFQVSGWMLNKLKLKGNELCVFAIIYGFSQDSDSWFTGSRKYIADFIGSTTATVDNCLTSLVNKGFIEKRETHLNGVKFNHYRAVLENLDTVKKIDTPSKNFIHPPIKNLDTPLQNFCTHNKEDIENFENTEEPPIYNPPENTPETPPQSQKVPDAFKDTLHELKCRVNTLFRRKETTAWDGKEIAALRQIAKRPGVLDEMKEIEDLYNSGYEYCRRDIRTFLNNWATELDRANNRKQRRQIGF